MSSGRFGAYAVRTECKIWPKRQGFVAAEADVAVILHLSLTSTPNVFN